MQDDAFDWDPLRRGLPIDYDEAEGSRLLTPLTPLAAPDGATAGDLAAVTLDPPPPEAQAEQPPVLVDGDGVFLVETAPEYVMAVETGLGGGLSAPAPDDEIDPGKILRDRPDVYAAFYREFYGPNNDRNSSAWMDRVGGETPEDYARYWYQAHGRYEGYAPESGRISAPAETSGDAPQGRTTLDGVPLAKILSERPDVFQAFFTEFYGPGNDRHSDAWTQRVGGTTVEDYANYWYNAHGRMGGYAPSGGGPAADPASDPIGAPDPVGEDRDPLPAEDPSLDPWNHPAIYPDWQPPYPGWQPPTADAGSGAPPADPGGAAAPAVVDDYPFARPLVVHYTEDGIELLPATLEEITAMRSLFDDTAI